MKVTSYFPCLYILLRKKFISITWNCQWFWDWIYFTPFIEYRLQNQRILELRLKINFLRCSNHWSILERTSTNFEIFQNNENILPIGVIALLYILDNTIWKKKKRGMVFCTCWSLYYVIIQSKDWLVIQSLCWTNIKPFTLIVTPLTAADDLYWFCDQKVKGQVSNYLWYHKLFFAEY